MMLCVKSTSKTTLTNPSKTQQRENAKFTTTVTTETTTIAESVREGETPTQVRHSLTQKTFSEHSSQVGSHPEQLSNTTLDTAELCPTEVNPPLKHLFAYSCSRMVWSAVPMSIASSPSSRGKLLGISNSST